MVQTLSLYGDLIELVDNVDRRIGIKTGVRYAKFSKLNENIPSFKYAGKYPERRCFYCKDKRQSPRYFPGLGNTSTEKSTATTSNNTPSTTTSEATPKPEDPPTTTELPPVDPIAPKGENSQMAGVYFTLLAFLIYGSFIQLFPDLITPSDSYLDKTAFFIFTDQQLGSNTETTKRFHLGDFAQAQSILMATKFDSKCKILFHLMVEIVRNRRVLKRKYLHRRYPSIGTFNHDLESEFIEQICLEIKNNGCASMIFSCIYRPPNTDASFVDYLNKSVDFIVLENKETHIVGDFNIDDASSDSRKLIRLMENQGFCQMQKNATRIMENYSTYPPSLQYLPGTCAHYFIASLWSQ